MKWRCASAFLLLLVLADQPGCSAAHRAERQKARETRDLAERVSACWMALRWADSDTSSACVQHAEQRFAFLKRLSSSGALRVSEAKVMQIELSDRLPAQDAPVLYRATVMVQVECVVADTQQVTSRLVLETWYRAPEGWFVEPSEEAGIF
jgi:hypothetical protein